MTALDVITQAAFDSGWDIQPRPANAFELRRDSFAISVGFTARGAVAGAKIIKLGPSGLLGGKDAQILDSAFDRNRRDKVLGWILAV